MDGQDLKKARLERGWSLEKVTELTHIRESYLEAIEENRFADLPSDVQGRGFIRLYAGLLGMDAAEILPPRPVEISPAEAPPEEKGEPEKAETNGRRSFPFPIKFRRAAGDGEEKERPTILLPAQKWAGRKIESQAFEVTLPPGMPPRQPSGKTSDQIFREIGAALRAQRERITLPFENVSELTHIPVHYLRAMEEGSFDRLPSLAQARGLLNNYASFLSLDADSLLLQYAEGLQSRRQELLAEKEQAVPPKRKPVQLVKDLRWRNFLSMDVLIITALTVIIIGSLAWGAFSILNPQNTSPTSQVPESISQVLLSTETPTPTLAETYTPTPGPTSVLAQTKMPTQEDNQPNPVDTQAGIVPPPAESTTPGDIILKPVQLMLVPREQVYVRVIVDGGTQFNGRILPGTPYSFSGATQIELITGNAGALQATFNNTDLGILGNTGQVLDLIFTLNGAATPTPVPSNTPTITPTASKTPRPSNTYPPSRTPNPTATPKDTATPKPTSTPKATVTK